MTSPEKMSVGALAFLNGYGTSSASDHEEEMPMEAEQVQAPDVSRMVKDILYEVLGKLDITDFQEDRKGTHDSSGDSDSEDEEYVKKQEWRRDSSSTSSSSSESSSGSEGDDEEDDDKPVRENVNTQLRKKKAKAEFSINDLPPIEDLQISVPDWQCTAVGSVSSIVDTLVVVQSLPGLPAMDLETVLFLDKGKRSLGRVFDVIGPVSLPLYCVRFNSKDHIASHDVEKGTKVYAAPNTQHTSYVFIKQLLNVKGTDASWKDDQETPSQFADYSDDESERTARKKNPSYKDGGEASTSAPPRKQLRGAYVPPRPNSQRSRQNVFYRQNRRYDPKDFGGIRWDHPQVSATNPSFHHHAAPVPPHPYHAYTAQPPPDYSVPPPPVVGRQPYLGQPPPPPPPLTHAVHLHHAFQANNSAWPPTHQLTVPPPPQRHSTPQPVSNNYLPNPFATCNSDGTNPPGT